MKIEQIERIPVLYHVNKEGWSEDLDYKKYTIWPARVPATIVKVHFSNGIIGVGEATDHHWYYGTTVEQTLKGLSLFERALKGHDARNLESTYRIMENTLGRGGPGIQTSKDAVHMALLDGLGKHYGEPVYNLLGGAHHTTFQLMTNLYLGEPEEMAEHAVSYAKRGYAGLKIKCGMDIEEKGWSLDVAKHDLRKLTMTLEAVPDTVSVDADSNQSWGTPKRTITLVKALGLEKYGNLGIEQPVHLSDIDGASRICKQISLPLILDETITSPEALIQVIRKNAADRIVIKPSRVGGLFISRKMISIAEAAGVNVSTDTTPYTKIGDTANCHLDATIREPYPIDAEGHTWMKENPVKRGGVILEGGSARIEGRPGLGIELDDEVIERIRLQGVTTTES